MLLIGGNNFLIGILLLLLIIVAGCSGKEVTLGEQKYRAAYTTETKKCIDCHSQNGISMSAIRDWKLSLHSVKKIGCEKCHIPIEEADESTATVSACENEKVRSVVSPKNCLTNDCHEEQGKQFDKSKHARAWDVIESTAKSHELIGGEQGCEACHRIGKDEEKCDSCHTRHRFSTAWARRPETCEMCHKGAEHPETEMYLASKHGSVYRLESHTWNWFRKLEDWYGGPFEAWSKSPRTAVCVTCHMHRGDHAITTTWGILAVPLVLLDGDEEWYGYRKTILKGIGVLDEYGDPTGREDIIEAGILSDLPRIDWVKDRDAMISICKQCHTKAYVTEKFKLADSIMKASDALMAEAISVVEDLYNSNVITRKRPFPAHGDILRFYETDTQIEQMLYKMFYEQRTRNFQGIYHFVPEYLQWYGWKEMKVELEKIRSEAEKLRGE